jgi:hypothetical protein
MKGVELKIDLAFEAGPPDLVNGRQLVGRNGRCQRPWQSAELAGFDPHLLNQFMNLGIVRCV